LFSATATHVGFAPDIARPADWQVGRANHDIKLSRAMLELVLNVSVSVLKELADFFQEKKVIRTLFCSQQPAWLSSASVGAHRPI